MTETGSGAGRFAVGPEMLERLLAHLRDQLDGCLGVGLNSGPLDGTGELVAGVGIAAALDPLQWTANAGPLVEASRSDDPVRVDDVVTDERWPDLGGAVALERAGQVGVVALPGGWSQGGLVVLSVYLDHAPTLADLRTIEDYEPLIATSAAVVEFCANEIIRTDQILDMVQHRRVIEQAKGIVMAHIGCDGAGAFTALVRISQQANVKLREFSVALVQRVGRAPAEAPERTVLGKRADTVLSEPHPDAVAADRAWQALRGNDDRTATTQIRPATVHYGLRATHLSTTDFVTSLSRRLNPPELPECGQHAPAPCPDHGSHVGWMCSG